MADASIEEFICRYFSLQQTALVDNMLYQDKHMDMYNGLYNLHVHTVDLSTGLFIGTHQQLMDKKISISTQLEHSRSKRLKHDIDQIEISRGIERAVYEWYSIPYWIARFMIDSNEVVLSWKDCYWWGRGVTGQPLTIETALISLYNNLTDVSKKIN